MAPISGQLLRRIRKQYFNLITIIVLKGNNVFKGMMLMNESFYVVTYSRC
jgi:hypothetical protein